MTHLTNTHLRRQNQTINNMKRKAIICILLLCIMSACSLKKQTTNQSIEISSYINKVKPYYSVSTCRFIYEDKKGIHQLSLSRDIYEKIMKALLSNENYCIKDSVPMVSPPLGTFYIGDKGYVWSGHANIMPLEKKDILVKLPDCFTLPENDFLEIIDNIDNSVKVHDIYCNFFSKCSLCD